MIANLQKSTTEEDVAKWPLSRFVSEGRRLHDLYKQEIAAGLKKAQEIGLLLLVAKPKIGHGKFADWIDKNMNFSARTAQDYMRIARNWHDVERVHSYGQAIKNLAKPKKKEPREYVHDDTEEKLESHIVVKAASLAAPRDAAELLYRTILKNDEPKAVADCLKAMLDSARFADDLKRKSRSC